jgi:transmembrane sensor
MSEKEFLNLIDRYKTEQVTADEIALVESLIEIQNQPDLLYSALSKEQRNESMRKVKQILDAKMKGLEPKPIQVSLIQMMRVAAAILFFAASGYCIWQFTSYPQEIQMVHASASGKIKKVLLPDGSIVWLKGNSELTYPQKFTSSTRNVELSGEALFEVQKDANHPFIIQCGELITTVLGTSFNIRSFEESIEVMVLTGKVSLTSETDKEGVVVLPSEKVIYKGFKVKPVRILTERNEKNATVEGTEYSMLFEDTHMSEIIQRIEGKFNVEVSLQDPRLRNCLITADFTDQSLDKTFNMISQALGITHNINGNKVILYGKGCN